MVNHPRARHVNNSVLRPHLWALPHHSIRPHSFLNRSATLHSFESTFERALNVRTNTVSHLSQHDNHIKNSGTVNTLNSFEFDVRSC